MTLKYKPKWWEITILLFGLIGLIWFLSCRYLAPSLENVVSFDISTKEYVMSKIQNGDLLFFAGTSQGERTIRFFHNSYFSHVCMVFRDERGLDKPSPENSIFVWEADLGQKYKDGPRIMRLSEKLNRWKGFKIGMWMRYIPRDVFGMDRPKTEDILNIAQEYLNLDKEMDMLMASWFFSRWPESSIFKFLKGNKVFCSELVVDTLQKLGIVDKIRHASWYSPESFVRGSVPVIKGTYGTPSYFKF
jgi:hypothetical protein